MSDRPHLPAGTVSPDEVRDHLHVLTRDIGVRLAGSDGERQAADCVAAVLARQGATVSIERFPVRERAVTEETLEVRVGET